MVFIDISKRWSVLVCDGKMCLVSGSWDETIKIWDVESHSVITILETDSIIGVITVFMNGYQVCVAAGGIDYSV